MPLLPSLPDDAVLLDVFKAFPNTAIPLIQYHEELMRAPSPLSTAERELIGAYVSGLNACHYCVGVHGATAAAFGVPADLVEKLVANVDSAPVEDRMKPLLRYVAKLTATPSRMAPADAQAVFDAGWSERALHDAVSVCALFSFMNRLVDGLGIDASEGYFQLASTRLSQTGYASLMKLLELQAAD